MKTLAISRMVYDYVSISPAGSINSDNAVQATYESHLHVVG